MSRNAFRRWSWILLTVLAQPAARTNASTTCPPPGALLRMIREATSVGMVRLGDRGSRNPNPLERGGFIGFQSFETFQLDSVTRAAVSRAFGEPLSYECQVQSIGPNRALDFPVQVGFVLTGKRGAVALLLLEPDQRVEMETPNGTYAAAPLSTEGASRWASVLVEMLRASGRTPEEFYVQMRAPGDSLPWNSASDGSHEIQLLDFDLAPRVRTPYQYPDLAREAGVDGTVRLLALVGPDGRVKDVRVVKSIPMLDQTAVEAVRQWEFVPWIEGGRPVTVWTYVSVRFSLH